jgi:hypothetical protein
MPSYPATKVQVSLQTMNKFLWPVLRHVDVPARAVSLDDGTGADVQWKGNVSMDRCRQSVMDRSLGRDLSLHDDRDALTLSLARMSFAVNESHRVTVPRVPVSVKHRKTLR